MSRFSIVFTVFLACFVFSSFSSADAFEKVKIDKNTFVKQEEIFVHKGFKGFVSVTHALFIINESGEAVIKTLMFSPGKYTHLKLLGDTPGEIKSENPAQLELELKPGKNEVVLSYAFPSQNNRILMDLSKNILVKRSYILVPADKFEVKGDEVNKVQEMNMKDVLYSVYTSGNTIPSAEKNIYIVQQTSGKAAAGVTGTDVNFHPQWLMRFWYQSPFSGLNPHIILIVVAAVAIFLLYLKLKNKREGSDVVQSASQTKKDEIIMDIHLLDEKFKNGEIDEEAYKIAREELKRTYAEEK
ncbi:MAG: hypothetical protein FXF49_08730 [Flexistipes sinusarabici]|uniref:SHOCT domain-containing protein n=1 Tax=Flexistipes sinusarabici TaxID=2352 RepID=A0A5D0MLY5_FLESI|nr:hypothetical protein [Flexistipes sinusarabici]TYB32955.1 MAG: hypothetical protein FXF49_08730 [Flexistipes sinusarabici]